MPIVIMMLVRLRYTKLESLLLSASSRNDAYSDVAFSVLMRVSESVVSFILEHVNAKGKISDAFTFQYDESDDESDEGDGGELHEVVMVNVSTGDLKCCTP